MNKIYNQVKKKQKKKIKIEAKAGRAFGHFEVVAQMTQLVAGLNYFFKINTGDDKHVHARVYKDLKGAISVHSVQEKTAADHLEYF